MTVEEIMNHYGSGYKFQKITGFSHTNIVNWTRNGCIPLTSQRKLNIMSHGALIVRLEDAIPQ